MHARFTTALFKPLSEKKWFMFSIYFQMQFSIKVTCELMLQYEKRGRKSREIISFQAEKRQYFSSLLIR